MLVAGVTVLTGKADQICIEVWLLWWQVRRVKLKSAGGRGSRPCRAKAAWPCDRNVEGEYPS